MKARLSKLLSTKFLSSLSAVVIGLLVMFGADESVVTTIVGASVALIAAVVYVVTEGKIDAASVTTAVASVQTIIDAVEKPDGK